MAPWLICGEISEQQMEQSRELQSKLCGHQKSRECTSTKLEGKPTLVGCGKHIVSVPNPHGESCEDFLHWLSWHIIVKINGHRLLGIFNVLSVGDPLLSLGEGEQKQSTYSSIFQQSCHNFHMTVLYKHRHYFFSYVVRPALLGITLIVA